MKLIFLDIDGVLATEFKHIDWFKGILAMPFNPATISQLNRITEATGAKIVLSSSWRLRADIDWFNEMFQSRGIKGEVIGKTKKLDTARGIEIKDFLTNFSEPVESFIIIDDDDDMEDLMARLVDTDTYKGLTEKCADKAIALLEK